MHFAIKPFQTCDFWSQTVRLGPDQLRPYRRVARTIQWGVAALSLLICGQARAQEASFLETLLKDNSNVMVVLDASGSMSEPWTDEATKFEAARAALINATTGLPSTTRSGAVAFGHRRNFDCSDIEVLSNPSAVPAALARALNEETPQDRGMRPLADAIETAAARLSQQNGPGAIVVLTDGAEECGGNSCALSAPLAQMQIPVHLIGLGMDAADAALLRCLPASAGGSFAIAEAGEELGPHIAKALSLSHTANAQRSAASIARLLLQQQDISVRDLQRIRGDLTRLDDAIAALDTRLETFAGRDFFTEELQTNAGSGAAQDVALVRAAANRLRDQLNSRDQMLIRMQDQTDVWNTGTLGLSRRADLAAEMAALSGVVAEPAEKLREGHNRLVERRAALETEMAATAAQSADLHRRINQIDQSLDRLLVRAESAQQLAQRIESGEPLSDDDQLALEATDQPVLDIIEQRDAQIAELELERLALLDQLKAVRAELMTAQEDVLVVQRQRADAESRVSEARDLLAGLQANQLAMKANWTAEIKEASAEHMQARFQLENELDTVLAQSKSLRTDLDNTRQALEESQATNLQLVTARNDALTEAAESKLLANQLESQNRLLTEGLEQCRTGREDLTRHIASLQADIADAHSLVAAREPDRVRFVLASGVALDADVTPAWTVEDASTSVQLDAGEGVDLALPKEAGRYRVIADLDGQLVERTFSVRTFEHADHEFSLDLAQIDLNLQPSKATEAATEPVDVVLFSPVYAMEKRVHAGQPTRLFVPAASYQLRANLGLDQWDETVELKAGEAVQRAIAVDTLPVALDLIAGERGLPIDDELEWVLRDTREPTKSLAFQGPQATVQLAPGIYDVEVAFNGFVASQTVFIDAAEPVTEPLQESVRFNDGAVRLSFSNNGEAVPDGLDLQWRIELQGAAIVTSQTLDDDIVQLPAGGYRLRAQANDVELERDFLVLAGQVTELAPDFTLGQVTLSLLDETGVPLDARGIEWSVIPQPVASDDTGFQGAMRMGSAIQTLLLPEGRYRVTAQTGAQTVERLISVKSGDKSSFGLILPAEPAGESLAQLSSGS